jgi:hypothetical protein
MSGAPAASRAGVVEALPYTITPAPSRDHNNEVMVCETHFHEGRIMLPTI